MAFVEPDTVTMRSGQEPSDIFIFAPDCFKKRDKKRIFFCLVSLFIVLNNVDKVEWESKYLLWIK